MSRMFRVAIALSLGVVLVLTVSVIAFAGSGNAVGQAVYQQYCAGCHGTNGQGTQFGPDIAGEGGDVREAVRQGEDGMPSFSTVVISNTQLRALSSYVSSLGNGGAASQYGSGHDADEGHHSGSGGTQYRHDD